MAGRMDDDDSSPPTLSSQDDADSLIRAIAAAPRPAISADFAELILLEPGTVIDGTFRIEDRLGAGGMGVVYLARDLRLDREVAIKLMRPERSTATLGQKLPEVFEREARATARLNHPSIVTLHQFGNWNGVLYLVLERLHGETLAARLARGALPLRDAVAIAEQVASALVHTHAAGITHRDLKPQNVFLVGSGAIKILDFGVSALARAPLDGGAPAAGERSRATLALVGTPGYMAPEQWRGAHQDARTDVWALGAMLHEIVTGTLPFGARPLEDGTPPPEIAVELPAPAAPLAPLIRRCLAFDPADRPDTEDVAATLRAVHAALAPRRAVRRWLVGGTLVAIGAAVAITYAAMASGSRARVVDPACAGARRELAGIWDDTTRTRLSTAFGAAGSGAALTWHEIERTLDQYTARWIAMRETACAAAASAQLACLDHARDELRALLEGYRAEPLGTGEVTAALREADSLPELGECVAPQPGVISRGSLQTSDPDVPMVLTVAGPGRDAVHNAATLGDDLVIAGFMSEGAELAGRRYDARRSVDSRGFVARLGRDGTARWRQGFERGGAIRAIAVAPDSTAIAVVGTYTEPVRFAGIPLERRSSGTADCFVASIDARSGALRWLRTCGATGLSVARGVAMDGEGNIYAIGDFGGHARFGGTVEHDAEASPTSAPFLASWSPDGVLRWVTLGRGTGSSQSYAVAAAGDAIVIATRVVGRGRLGSRALDGGCSLARVNRVDGAVRWLRHLPEVDGDCRIRALAIADDRAGIAGAMGGGRGWVAEVALADGQLRWQKSFLANRTGHDPIRAAAYSQTGRLTVVGWFNAEVLALDDVMLAARGRAQGFVAAFDPQGRCIGASALGGDGAANARSIGLGDRGRLLVGGRFDIGFNVAGRALRSAGESDGFLLELAPAWLTAAHPPRPAGAGAP